MNSSGNNKYIKVIHALNDKPKFFFIPQDKLIPIVVIVTTLYVLFEMFLDMGLFWWLTSSLWFSIAWWFLAGENSYDFTDQFFPLPGKGYFNQNTLFIPATDIGVFNYAMKQKKQPKFKSQITKTANGKKQKIIPFQIESDLHAIMEIEDGSDNFAVLLKCDRNGEWSATIPFALDGIHPELYDSEAEGYTQALSEALKDIPFAESLTLYLGCRSQTRKRVRQIHELLNQSKSQLIDLTLMSEELKIEEITQKGFRQEWSQFALVTWTRIRQDLRKKNDLLSVMANSLRKFFSPKIQSFSGTADRVHPICAMSKNT